MTREEFIESIEQCEAIILLCGTDDKEFDKKANVKLFEILKNDANKLCDEHEVQLKAKENHIVELNKMVMEKNEIIDVLHISSSGFNDLYDDYRKLSRKIVAMLFWEWRKQERRFNQEWERDKTSITCAEFCVMSANAEKVFKKAYAMLKDKQC